MECKREENAANCSCGKTDCGNRGKCCDCVADHRAKGQLPACLRNIFKDQETMKFEK